MPLHHATPDDPRGLIAEAYNMEIQIEDCRSIFFDWALGEAGPDLQEKLQRLAARFADAQPDHPMTAVLREGQKSAPDQRRRGGRAARLQ